MTERAAIGLIGLGTMGANLALNIAEAGHRIAVFNRSPERTRAFHAGAGDLAERIVPTESLDALVGALATPRMILMMVPAGAPVTEQIAALTPHLAAGDILIDGGNSDWGDSRDRADSLAKDGLRFLGLGVSGGAEGARHGPSMMAGGHEGAWEAAAPILTSIAARFEDSPCAAYFGAGGAGHYVKTVHNGIEYADMQMIAEIYGLMRDGQGRDAADIGALFARWNAGPLESYLIEIAAEVAATEDPDTGGAILDVIADRAGQKGTGRWTVIDAQTRAAPLPAVEAAVTARVLSGEADLRARGATLFPAQAGSGYSTMPIWRPRCWSARSSPIPRASRSWPARESKRIGPCRLMRSPRHGGRAASSARPCSTIWPALWQTRPTTSRSPSRPASSRRSRQTFPPCAG
jgi:6-phosphogluconate dehydrogenase